MNYQKVIKLFALLIFLSLNANAELKPYKAVYDVYNKGFHIGIATKKLTNVDDYWIIDFNVQATGLAAFMQRQPEIQQQTFRYHQQPFLISTKRDTGKSDKNAISTAYYDAKNSKLLVSFDNKSYQLKSKTPPLTYLLSEISAANLQTNNTKTIKLYDKGKIKTKKIITHENTLKTKVIDIKTKNSSSTLRYHFKKNNLNTPYKIERIKKNKVKAYLLLKEFNLIDDTL